MSLKQHNIDNELLRKRQVIETNNSSTIIIDKKKLINFTSNDYLDLAKHSAIKKAFADGAAKYGLGSGSSSLISGYSKPHKALEDAFCEFLNRERAILFNSGYHANLGVINSLANKSSTIIADKYCHASIIDGIILSRAKLLRYHHNDLNHAEKVLNENPGSLVISESVFSMQGNITDAKLLNKISNNNLIIDDAHGIGVIGKNGKGIIEYDANIPCLVTPLGKSLASFGAIVTGSNEIIETILQKSRTYCYTTALPPAISYATLASLKIIESETWRRDKLKALIGFFNKEAESRNISLISEDETPIKCIITKTNSKTLEIQKSLIDLGVFVSCIRPPTVPKDLARIRISLCASHTEDQIVKLLDIIGEKLNAY